MRPIQLLLGLALWGLASTLLIRSGLGLGPWDAFHVGAHLQTGLSVGTVAILTGLLILCITMLMRVRPGIATIANMILIGLCIDLLLPIIPDAHARWLGALYFAAGIAIAGIATGLYIGAGYGQGPRDALMIAIHRHTGWTVQRARFALEAVVLAAGWLMGGRVGLGTLVFALSIGPVVQWGMRTFPPPAPTDPEGDVRPDETGERHLPRAA